MYCPSLLELALRSTPVSTFTAFTVTPGTTRARGVLSGSDDAAGRGLGDSPRDRRKSKHKEFSAHCKMLQHFRCGGASDDHQLERGSDSPQIVRIAGDDGLAGPLRAINDMGIDNVGRRGSRQQKAGSRRVRSIERDKVRAGLTD